MNSLDTISSRHFWLEQLAEGVYAAINADQGWAICNAGIIDLGDRTLIYDSFISPQAAGDLREVAEKLTGRPVHAVINSHYHNDHIWGNQAFSPETDIISNARTRELIITEGAKEVSDCNEFAPARLETLQTQLANTVDETSLKNLRLYVVYYQAITSTLPILQVRLPNITFTENMTFDGTRRSASLITYEGGHCSSDAILYLPDDGIIFMEDLLFSQFHPYLAECDPAAVHHILAQVRAYNAVTFVPGHGPVSHADQLDWMDGYIDQLNSLVGEFIKSGGAESELDHIAIPAEYRDLLFPSMFPGNLKFLYQWQLKK